MTFKKGQSGNPGGRPKIAGHIRELARQHGEAAFARILELMASDNDKVALAAAQQVLDRAYGKPPSTLAGEGGEGAAQLLVVTGIRREGDTAPPSIENRVSIAGQQADDPALEVAGSGDLAGGHKVTVEIGGEAPA